MSELTDRIDDAFTRPNFEDAIRLVKAAVTRELTGLDNGLGVEHTRFFNHAIYPDFVLHWHERGEARERPLFLRFEVAEGTVGQDLRLHGEKDPCSSVCSTTGQRYRSPTTFRSGRRLMRTRPSPQRVAR
jgi:hypothetical protein